MNKHITNDFVQNSRPNLAKPNIHVHLMQSAHKMLRCEMWN